MSDTEDPAGNLIWNDLTNRSNMLKNMFAEVEVEYMHSIPEDIFVNMFLPLFSGESLENKNELLQQWYTVAGTPYAAVNVIDPNGVVVAVVPPILNRNAIPVVAKREGRGSLETLFDHARQKATMSPNLAQNIVINELKGRFLEKAETGPNSGLTAQWEALLAHYGKSLVPSVKVNAINANIADDFDYE